MIRSPHALARTALRLFVSLLALSLSLSHSRAQSTSLEFVFGTPSAVPTDADSDSNEDWRCELATDGAGTWIAVWEREVEGGLGQLWDYSYILLSRSTDSGQTWSDPEWLSYNSPTGENVSYQARIATDGTGNWIVVWYAQELLSGALGADNDVMCSRSTDNGVTWSAAAPVNTNAATDGENDNDSNPDIATDGNGAWIVVWEADYGPIASDNSDLVFSRSTNNGDTWSAAQRLNSSPTPDDGNDLSPCIRTDGQGNWVTVWWYHPNDLFGDYDLKCARSIDNGVTWSNSDWLNANYATDAGMDWYPLLTTDRKGTWIAYWSSDDDLQGWLADDDLWIARSLDAGQTWSAPMRINTDAAVDSAEDSFPALDTDGHGNWIAVWPVDRNPFGLYGSDDDLFYAYSTDGGLNWSDPAAFNSNAASDTGYDGLVHLANNGLGQWLAVWDSSDSLGGTIDDDSDVLSMPVFVTEVETKAGVGHHWTLY